METKERVLTKSVLLDSISLDMPDCTESSLKMHVSSLRRKLKDAGCNRNAEIEMLKYYPLVMPKIYVSLF